MRQYTTVMLRIMLLCGWCCALLGSPTTLHAEDGAIVLESEAAFNGNYTPGSWLPIHWKEPCHEGLRYADSL